LPEASTSHKQPAPSRPLPSTEATRRLSSSVTVNQSSAAQTRPAVTSYVPPYNNNNVIYSNDVNDWTDDEWDDDEDEEEMTVSSCSN